MVDVLSSGVLGKMTANKGYTTIVNTNMQFYGVGLKGAVNLRNGDIVAGATFSPVYLPSRIGGGVEIDLGWLINLESAEIRTSEGRQTGKTITKGIEGTGVGISGCYRLICAGYSQSVSSNKNIKAYHFLELGVGFGGSGGAINQENTFKIGDDK